MAWDSYIEKNQDRFVDELSAFISIPSVSAADEHFQDVVKAGDGSYLSCSQLEFQMLD